MQESPMTCLLINKGLLGVSAIHTHTHTKLWGQKFCPHSSCVHHDSGENTYDGPRNYACVQAHQLISSHKITLSHTLTHTYTHPHIHIPISHTLRHSKKHPYPHKWHWLGCVIIYSFINEYISINGWRVIPYSLIMHHKLCDSTKSNKR